MLPSAAGNMPALPSGKVPLTATGDSLSSTPTHGRNSAGAALPHSEIPMSLSGEEPASTQGRDGMLPSAAGNMPGLPSGKVPLTATDTSLSSTPTHARDSACDALPQRKRPAHGVFISTGLPTIVFLTVCTHQRMPWLACRSVHAALVQVWKEADAWTVGGYLLMPDHVHMFCSPRTLEFTLDAWVSHWKRKFSRLRLPGTGAWQRGFWDTRLRREENYGDKWEYVRQNPWRKGLASQDEPWPYQGILNELWW
jgi:REP element-mobilizing transposase RayT